MSDAPVPNGGSADAPTDINKRSIWSFWHKAAEWQDELYRKAAHKSLDIPDPMNITNMKSGIGTLGVMGIVGAASLPATILAGYMLWKDAHPATPSQQQSPPPFSVNDSEYDVLFYDRDGNPIWVPHISTKPK